MKENRNDDSDDFLGRIRHAVAHILPRPAPHEAVSHFRRPMRALSQSQDLEGLSELAASRLYVFSFFLFLVLLMHVAFFFSQVADANRWGGKIISGHINNLYNTTFWNMVLQGGMGNSEAEHALKVGKPHSGINSSNPF